MSYELIRVLTDDLTGEKMEPGKGATIAWSFEGKHMEIDLSEKNADEFRKAVDKYLAASRNVTMSTHKPSSSGRKRSNSTGAKDPEVAAAREWLIANGHLDKSRIRGRISDDLMSMWRSRGQQQVPMPTPTEEKATDRAKAGPPKAPAQQQEKAKASA